KRLPRLSVFSLFLFLPHASREWQQKTLQDNDNPGRLDTRMVDRVRPSRGTRAAAGDEHIATSGIRRLLPVPMLREGDRLSPRRHDASGDNVTEVYRFTRLRLGEQEPLDQNLSDGYHAHLKKWPSVRRGFAGNL